MRILLSPFFLLVMSTLSQGSIPKELGEFKGLQKLQVSHNRLSAIGDVGEAQWLLSRFEGRAYGARIDLRGNPWIMPPEAVVENGMASIKAYYTDVQRAIEAGARVTSRRLLKVVLVGSASAGKTSLMESIISKSPNRTAGTPEEASTEGIDIRPHQLENISVEFYDCAGQVDYAGMHQVFLTRRALFLLVWDITRCSGLSDSYLDEEIHGMIMRWLYALHLRAPGTMVILVANKCDKATDDIEKTIRRVETRVKIMLNDWKERRGQNHLEVVNLFSGSFPVSCENYTGITDLIDRVNQHGATRIDVPPAWDLALHVIDALRRKRSSMNAARSYLGLSVNDAAEGTEQSGSFISRGELSKLWGEIVRDVRDDVLGTRNEVAVNNWSSALEGALWISEFAGQILLVEDGAGIFFDVVWLSDLLTPILSHKLGGKSFPTMALCALRDDLVDGKILRWEFARHLWRSALNHPTVQSSENIGHALYSVLMKLGVALPLGHVEVQTASLVSRNVQQCTSPPDMLVIMRLRETCGIGKERLLEERTREALIGVSDVTLKWVFDAAGCPYGLMERLIVQCHKIGVVEHLLCWRHGALFRSHERTRRVGKNMRLYTMIIRFDKTLETLDGNVAHILTARMMGPLKSPEVWTALRFVASAVLTLSKEWPGVIMKGSPVCPRHPRASTTVYLTMPDEAHIGDPLIPRVTPGTRSTGCECHTESDEVVGLVIKQLGPVVDIEKDPFKRLLGFESSQHDSESALAGNSAPVTESETPLRNNLSEMCMFWRPFACQTAVGLWGLALVLFGGITAGVIEEKNIFWLVCLAMMSLSLVGAVIASVVSYREMREAIWRDVSSSAQEEGDVEIPLTSNRP